MIEIAIYANYTETYLKSGAQVPPGLVRLTRHLGRPTVSIAGVQMKIIRHLWSDEQAQDIAEYAVMLAVILVLVVGTIRLVGSNANNAFSQVASSMNQ
jgi:Flp pilus assembly pilin Flp